MSPGFGHDDGPVAVRELTPMVADAETFGEWQGRCEPLDCLAHVGIVQDGYYGGVRCGAVLLQHGLGGYQRFPGSPNVPKLSGDGGEADGVRCSAMLGGSHFWAGTVIERCNPCGRLREPSEFVRFSIPTCPRMFKGGGEMSTTTLIIVVVVILIVFGGFGYSRRRR